jgi:hypothetical protein
MQEVTALKKIIVLALILLASMFVTMFATNVVAAATINVSRIDTTSKQTPPTRKVNPLGDPIDGTLPPGSR